MQEFGSFHSIDTGRQAQKTQLELYLDEPRADRNAKLDMLFGKEMNFGIQNLQPWLMIF